MYQFGKWLAEIWEPHPRRKRLPFRKKLTRALRRSVEPLERRLMLDAGPVSITEFLALNDSGLRDEDGHFSDWIEIYNGGSQPADLGGWHLTDDPADMDKWEFSSQTLDAGRYLVVFASGKDRVGTGPDGEHHTNFNLDASGEYLALIDGDGEIASQFAPAFPEQRKDVSYGIGQQLVGEPLVSAGDRAMVFVPADGSLGLDWTGAAAHEPFDDSPGAGWIAATTGVGFDADGGPVAGDEPFGQDAVGRSSLDSWHGSTIFNTPFPNDGTGGSATITSWRFYCDDGAAVGREITPLLVESVGGEYIVRGIGATRTVNSSGLQDYSFDVQSGTDTFDRSSERFHMGVRFGSPTVSNPGVVEFDGGGSSWAFYGQGGALSSVYDVVVDRPVTGPQVLSSLGRDYSIQFLLGSSGLESLLGDGSAAIESAMRDNNASAYLRTEFAVQGEAEIGSLLLRMQYDDGFVAYLNGVEVARNNAPDLPAFDSAAPSDRSRAAAAQAEDFDLTSRVDLLRDGVNVLAIHGLNHSADSGDFLILPELVAVKTSANRYLSAATPGAANVGGVIDFVADTTFSVDRGFFSEPFDVVITTDTPGATIVYTTNGSFPTLSNGTRVAAADPQSPPLATVHVADTTTLRAAAFKDDYQPTNVDTHTYFFTADVVRQGVMSSTIRDHAVWGPQLEEALLAIPTVSLVTPHTISQTERETSVELIFPDGSPGFQVDAGVEHFGGHSLGYPKKSMRISFKKEYGPARLHFDLFGDGATDEFDQFLLRSGSHDTVFYTNGTRGIYVRNRWISDKQLEMGQPAPHGGFVHVYINGTYWGQHQLMERPNAAFMESYFGGDKEEYDALNAGNPVDGDRQAWDTMAASAGNYTALQQYMDVVNYADYMLLQFYCGNDWDWNHWQNWMAARKQESGAQFKFFPWDNDMILRRGLHANVIDRGGPGNLWGTIKQHEEFRMLLADRAQKYFFNDGILTPDRVLEDFQRLADQVETSIIAETARWGASETYTPATWQQNVNTVRTQIIPERTNVVVQQMRDAGVFPQVDAPGFSQLGGVVPRGFGLTLTATTTGGPGYENTAVLPEFSSGRYFVPADNTLGTTWAEPEFVDDAWTTGTTGIGYENSPADYRDLIKTAVRPADSSPDATSVLVRARFSIDDLDEVDMLTLRMKYDDGFVAYPTTDGAYHSLHRLGPQLWGNDPDNWTALLPSPGTVDLADDLYEPNNAANNACVLEADWIDVPLSLVHGIGIQRDEDWYAVRVDAAQRRLTATIEFTHLDGDIDLAVIDAEGTAFARAESITDNEQLDVVLPASGVWYLRLYGENAGNQYDLRWNTQYVHPGDANLDDVTDVRDFNIWNANKFTSGTDWGKGDFNGDRVTDVRDFNIWNANKFTSAPALAPAGIPPNSGQRMVVTAEPPALDAILDISTDGDALLDELAWMWDLEESRPGSQSSADASAKEAVDALLATYWP